MLRNGPPALSDFDEGIRLGLESLLTTNYRQKEANKTNEGLKVIGGLGDGKFDQNIGMLKEIQLFSDWSKNRSEFPAM